MEPAIPLRLRRRRPPRTSRRLRGGLDLMTILFTCAVEVQDLAWRDGYAMDVALSFMTLTTGTPCHKKWRALAFNLGRFLVSPFCSMGSLRFVQCVEVLPASVTLIISYDAIS